MSDNDVPVLGGDAAPAGEEKSDTLNADGTRREAVRLTTVFGGRICQYGKAYACVISDVSAGGAKVRLKDPNDFMRVTQAGETQLIFERLSDYKALNCVVAWVRPEEHTVGLRFIDPELRMRMVMRRLMPTRWRLANDKENAQEGGEPVSTDTEES